MAIDFPNSPAPGDNYVVGSKTWTFTNGKWSLNVSSAGVTGASGAAATIAVGTVTTGAAGTSAVVTNSGSSSAAVFNITIPRGATGATGAASTVAGPTGPTGAAGTNGTNGAAGATGPTGPTGAAGTNGADGATGAAGPGANQALNTYNGVSFSYVDVGSDGYRTGGGMTSSASTTGVVRRSDGILCFNGSSSVSKRQYKNNIVDIENALPSLLGLRPRNFTWTNELVNTDSQEDVYDMQTQQQYGFIVEEVVETLSDLVHHEVIGSAFEPQMWKSNAVLALAVKAIQELSAQVTALKLELDELKSS